MRRARLKRGEIAIKKRAKSFGCSTRLMKVIIFNTPTGCQIECSALLLGPQFSKLSNKCSGLKPRGKETVV